MGSPTESEIQAMGTALIDLIQTEYAAASSWLANQDTLEQLLEGDFVGAAASGISALRSSKASLLSPAQIRAAWDPIWRFYGKERGFPETDARTIISRLYRDFVDNSKSVGSRAFSFGSPSAAGGNTGDAVIRRLTADQDGFDIEFGLAEAMSAECLADQGSVNIHEESWQLKSSEPARDGLEVAGTGRTTTVSAISARNSLLTNPSFTQGTSGSSVSGWGGTSLLAGSVALTSKDTTNFFRTAGVGDTGTSLDLGAQSASLEQKINTEGIKLQANVPYTLQVAYNRAVNTDSGTLALHLGSKSTSVVLSAQAGWNVLFLPLTSNNCWWKNYGSDDMSIKLVWTRTSGAGLLLDDVILAPMTPFRGQYYAVIGGGTPSLIRDSFTWTDTGGAPATGKIQYWLQRAYGLYLPSSGSPTWADPT